MGAVSGGGVSWTLASKDWDSSLPAGDTIDIKFIVGYSGARVGITSMLYGICFYFYIMTLPSPARGGDRDLRDLRVRG